jgi:hypothetical protein
MNLGFVVGLWLDAVGEGTWRPDWLNTLSTRPPCFSFILALTSKGTLALIPVPINSFAVQLHLLLGLPLYHLVHSSSQSKLFGYSLLFFFVVVYLFCFPFNAFDFKIIPLDWLCNSVIDHLVNMYEFPGSLPTITKKQQKKFFQGMYSQVVEHIISMHSSCV